MVCLDSDILIAFMRGYGVAIKTVRRFEEMSRPLKTTSINEYELLKGAAVATNPDANLRAVRQLLSGIQVLTLSNQASEVAADVYAQLLRRGSMIGEFDILVAAIAVSNEETLVSRDTAFKRIQNLSLESW